MLLDSAAGNLSGYIRTDGLSICSQPIPFAKGLSVPLAEKIQLGSSNDTYISNLLSGYLDIVAGATNPVLRLYGNTVGTGGVQILTASGQTFYDASGYVEHVIPNALFWAVTDRNEDPMLQVIANTTIGSASVTSYAPFSANNTLTASSTVTLSAQTADKLLYANGSKAINSATVSSPLSFSSGALSISTTPTFTGLTLSGLTANTPLYANGSKAITSGSVTSPITFSAGVFGLDQTANYTWSGTHQWDNTGLFDLTNVAAFTVRRDSSGGNVFVVDTTNRQIILGANDANDINIAFDATNDGSIKWDSADKTFYTRSNGAPEFLYPTYEAGTALVTYLTNSGARYALQAWGMPNTGASGSVGGFWGGFSDGENFTGAPGGDTKSGFSLSEVYAGTFYNYFGAINARTISSIYGNYAGNEFASGSQITSTNIRGLYVTAGEGGGTIASATNVIGIDVANPAFTCTGTCTNTYSIKLGNASTLGTNNYGIFWAGANNATWRAGTQAMWSPAANTLRDTANTTREFYIGANPSNGTAGTLEYSMTATLFTLADGNDFGIGSTTGSKLGQSGSKIGVYGTTPVVRPNAYTQTYSTATRTHAARTASTLTDSTGGTADTTVAAVSGSGADATINNNFADLVSQINKLKADGDNSAQVLNQSIDDFQLIGWLQ